MMVFGMLFMKILFVFDELSIGLYLCDFMWIVEVMQWLCDVGNMLVVVEYDLLVMFVVDCLIDMGFGLGECGGMIVYDGMLVDIWFVYMLMGEYFGGCKQVVYVLNWVCCVVDVNMLCIVFEGVIEYNLCDVMVEILLQWFVCVMGVFGFGKFMLLQDVLYLVMVWYYGKVIELLGVYCSFMGVDQVGDVVFVDQLLIGKIICLNLVSYVGVFDEICKLFVKVLFVLQCGYGVGMFSFNLGDGCCLICGGLGFEYIEMQFLSDVYLCCLDCDGSCYCVEIFEVCIECDGCVLNIVDVFDFIVSEVVVFFVIDVEVLCVLQLIVDVGFEYVKFGQLVLMLLGGEVQCLKFVGFFVELVVVVNGCWVVMEEVCIVCVKLFMFDELIIGLYFDDIVKLMQVFGKLFVVGYLLIVIEYNFDVICVVDWLIDFGLEGGDGGGFVLCVGMFDDVKVCVVLYIGVVLLQYDCEMDGEVVYVDEGVLLQVVLNVVCVCWVIEGEDVVWIVNVCEYNLKLFDVDILYGKFNVIIGVLGFGKLMFVFDILFYEGQCCYFELLNVYVCLIVQLVGCFEVDVVYGILLIVVIEQWLLCGGCKSMVVIMFEVWYFLWLLYVKFGLQYCIYDGMLVML